MGIGESVTLKVDHELLAKYGDDLQTAALGLPNAPAPFVVTGTDAISTAIAGKLPDIEGGIQEALPRVKADAATTASNIISAAGKYKGTDETLAAEYEKHQFDQGGASATGNAGGSAGGGSGGGGSADAMSQMMGMPMQMAGQAAQMPMQAMGAVAAAPQAAMQAVQQIGQMAGGLGTSGGDSQEARPDELDERSDDEEKQESQPDAAAGPSQAERAPDTLAAVQQQRPAAEVPN